MKVRLINFGPSWIYDLIHVFERGGRTWAVCWSLERECPVVFKYEWLAPVEPEEEQ